MLGAQFYRHVFQLTEGLQNRDGNYYYYQKDLRNIMAKKFETKLQTEILATTTTQNLNYNGDWIFRDFCVLLSVCLSGLDVKCNIESREC